MFEEDETPFEDETPQASDDLRAAFPVFTQKDFESSVNRASYKIGVDNSYPAHLRKMVSASVLTYQLNNRSVDHVLKTYLRDHDYKEIGAENRLDRSYKRACIRQVSCFQAALKSYPPLVDREPRVGEWIGDLTIIRLGYSLQRAFAEADKGALFEAVAIARMILEQISWVVAIRREDDVGKAKKVSATKSVGIANADFPMIGRLYGWMSNHAHWAYDAHVKVITSMDGFSGAWLFTTRFKAIGYAMLIAVTSLITQVAASLFAEYPELADTKELKDWESERSGFAFVSMIEKIYELDSQSSDIATILDIVKVKANHG